MHSTMCKLREIAAPAPTIARDRLRKGSQRCELFLRIRARVDFRMDLRDAALFVDQVRDAASVLIFRRFGRAVRQTDLVVGIAQQREVELLFLGEFPVRFDAVETGAEDLGVLRGVVGGEVSEPETFGGSTGCVGLREEPQHDFLATIVAELHATAGVIGGFELGSGITDFQHRRASSHAFEHMTDHSRE